jgi:hypothetical protein
MIERKKQSPAKSNNKRLSFLLKFAGQMIVSLIAGLELADTETRKRIMQLCGEACAREEFFGPSLEVTKRIGEEEIDTDKILERANEEILWYGKWERKGGDMILCTCSHCGCPLVENNVVKLTKTFRYCSLGWIKSIFETLLNKSVRVDLKTAIGFGDKECRFVIHM